jgi:hypothetical protein
LVATGINPVVNITYGRKMAENSSLVPVNNSELLPGATKLLVKGKKVVE